MLYPHPPQQRPNILAKYFFHRSREAAGESGRGGGEQREKEEERGLLRKETPPTINQGWGDPWLRTAPFLVPAVPWIQRKGVDAGTCVGKERVCVSVCPCDHDRGNRDI